MSDPVVRAVDTAEPAVVRILTQVQAHLTVNFPGAASVTFPQDGTSYPLVLSGTGTFITANGDILTADHVVNPPHDAQLSQGLDTLAGQDVAAYVNQHSQPNSGQVTSDQVVQALQAGQLPSTPQYGTTQSAAFLNTSYTGQLTATSFQNLPPQVQLKVDRIEKESPPNVRDTAIVHVAATDTPNVTVGNSTGVQQQDTLTIVGFPGNADVSSRPTDIFTTSINKVIVSATKTTDAGAPLIQVGGNVEQGDSGGPALDSKGAIVGIVSFSIAGNTSPGNTNFLQASASAQQLIQSLNLNTSPGQFQRLWSQALADYASTAPGHWHKAQTGFQRLQDSYPQFKAVTPYLTYANQQAQNEPTGIAGSPTSVLFWTLGVIGLVLLLLLLLLFFALSRRNRRKPALATGAMGGNTSYLFQSPPAQAYPSNTPHVPNTSPSASAYGGSFPAFGGPPNATFGMNETMPPVGQPQQPSFPAMGQGQSLYPPVPQTPSQQPSFPPVAQPSQSQGSPYFSFPNSPVQGMGQSNDMGQLRQSPGVSEVYNNANSNSGDVTYPWPCGHVNRANARFCGVCGAPAPAASSTPASTPSFDYRNAPAEQYNPMPNNQNPMV